MDRQIKAVMIVLILNFSIVPFVSHYYSAYIPRTHELVVQERGISENETWGVSVFGYRDAVPIHLENFTTSESTVTITLPYGYYFYKPINPERYVANGSPTYFHLAESKSVPAQVLNFMELHFLNFTLTGTSLVSSWTVTLFSPLGEKKNTASGTNLSFSEPAGNYRYKIEYNLSNTNSTSVYPQFPSTVDPQGEGNVTISESDVVVTVPFSSSTYPVTFDVIASSQVNTGNLNGIGIWIYGQELFSQYSFSTGLYEPIGIALPNGTYGYEAQSVPGYVIANEHGIVAVEGGPANLTISYTYKYQ